ncbi:GAF domain-containing protein [Siccirubricoccus deserti]
MEKSCVEDSGRYRRILNPRRLGTLSATGLLDSPAEEAFDRFTRLARAVLDAPLALVSLVDDRRQFFKSAQGLPEPWASCRETPLSHSFCKLVVVNREPLVVSDARTDPRVRDNGAVADLGVIAYLGVPLLLNTEVLGSFCVVDTKPREWMPREVSMVRDLAAAVEAEIALRAATERATRLAQAADQERREKITLLDSIGDGVYGVDAEGRCTFVNRAALEMLDYACDCVLGHDMHALIHHTRPDGSPYPKDECPMLRSVRDGQAVRLENEVLWRRDGTPFAAEYSSFPILNGGAVVGSVLTFSDTTRRQDAHKRLSVQYAASRALAEATDVQDALPRALAAIGTGLGWEVGFSGPPKPPGGASLCRDMVVADRLRGGVPPSGGGPLIRPWGRAAWARMDER